MNRSVTRLRLAKYAAGYPGRFFYDALLPAAGTVAEIGVEQHQQIRSPGRSRRQNLWPCIRAPTCLSRKRLTTRCTMRSTGREFGMGGEQNTQRDRKRQHPLPDWHPWNVPIDQVRSHLHHVPRAAEGGKPPQLARFVDTDVGLFCVGGGHSVDSDVEARMFRQDFGRKFFLSGPICPHK